MKVRNGFVSNSSSASFLISKCELTVKQIEMINTFNEVDHENDPEDGAYLTVLENEIAIMGWSDYGKHWLEDWLTDKVGIDIDNIAMDIEP